MIADECTARCLALIRDIDGFNPADVTDIQPLEGGVSSDIFVISFEDTRLCAKFALDKLKVAETWRVPTSRNSSEYKWLTTVSAIAPESVPRLYGYSSSTSGFAMGFIEGDDTYQWKAHLLKGMPDDGQALAVADLVGRIHSQTALLRFETEGFNNLELFDMIRIDPYLRFLASRHPELVGSLNRLITSLRQNQLTLIHGDVSPKNILFQAGIPILLDAECATIGDPCFDIAFCLNHLVLKALHLPASRRNLFGAARTFMQRYRRYVDWEDYASLDARVAALLPALMLARVDGKSPVEYLTAESKKRLRALAGPRIATPPSDTDSALSIIENEYARS